MMKKYIEPSIKLRKVWGESIMLSTSDGEGYGGPMSKENNSFEAPEEEQKIPSLHSVWEE